MRLRRFAVGDEPAGGMTIVIARTGQTYGMAEDLQVSARWMSEGWQLRVEGIADPLYSRSLARAEEQVRQALEAAGAADAADASITISAELPEVVTAHLRRADELRVQASAATAQASQESTAAARALKAQGLTVRDIGAALGLSFQRAQQLITGPGR